MYKLLAILATLWPLVSAGQASTLSYREAVAQTLKSNFDIRLAQADAAVARVQNNYGNAGFLPVIDLNASANTANNNTHQEFSNGSGVNRNGVGSSNVTAGAYLSWTIFDGMKMFAAKERLNLIEQQGELNVKLQLESSIEQVTMLYYQVVRQQQWIRGIEAAMTVTNERIKVANKRIDLGSGSRVELLQAQMDLNAQKANLLEQQNGLNDTKRDLLRLMQSDMGIAFTVDTVFTFDELPSMEKLLDRMEEKNYAIQFAKRNQLVAAQYRKELKADELPKVALNSNYVFSRSENGAGLVLLNRNLGFNAGLSVKWTIYNGSVLKNQQRIADMQSHRTDLLLDRLRFGLKQDIDMAYRRWLAASELRDLEEANIVLAEESLRITMERLKLGLGNYLEVRESANSYEAAITRLVNARYDLKKQETLLKRLAGELVK